MTERTLSSAQTFFMKIVFPLIWLPGGGFVFLRPVLKAIHSGIHFPLPVTLSLALFIGLSGLILYSCIPLKKVRTDGSVLYVSNFIKEERIPLEAIRDITEKEWNHNHPVTIHFRTPTPFGNRISFMPPFRPFLYGPHPVTRELRRMARLPRSNNSPPNQNKPA